MIDKLRGWLLSGRPPTSEDHMPNTFRLPMAQGYFIVQRRFVIGCTVDDDKLVVFINGIVESFTITDPAERTAFLRFIGGCEPKRAGQ